MSLLSAVNDVLGEIGLDPITSVESTSDPRARALLAVAKAAQNKLGRVKWPMLQLEHTFPTVVGQSDYDLPTDFRAILYDTAYNTSNLGRLRGSCTPQEWQYMVLNGAVNSPIRFRISGYASKFRITPEPTAVETVSFWYTSKNLATTSLGVAKELAVLDTDIFKFNEDLVKREIKWRFLRQRGLDYAEDFREAAEALELEFAQALALPSLMLGSQLEPDITDGYVREMGYGT